MTDSKSWTGRGPTPNYFKWLTEKKRKEVRKVMWGPQAEPVEVLGSGAVENRYAETEGDTMVATVEYPKSCKITSQKADAKAESYLKEYAELAALTGVTAPDLLIENFKAFLDKNDIPVFSLVEVIKYMDAKAHKESKEQAGWDWRPLREKDNRLNISFGKQPLRRQDKYGSRSGPVEVPASDYYKGPYEELYGDNGQTQKRIRQGVQSVYNRTVPLHALRKVALIEKEFGDTVGIFVCDYALAPQIEYPDPFLMAVVANLKVAQGEGRFCIDFWAEPGFGIEQMLK